MSLTILVASCFSLLLFFINFKNKYNYFFILMMAGMSVALATIIVEIAKNSNYYLPQTYFLRGMENVLYNLINRAMRIPLSTRLWLRGAGIFVYLIANAMFVFSFNNSVLSYKKATSLQKRSIKNYFLLPVVPLFCFFFFSPWTAYNTYIIGNTCLINKKELWFFLFRLMDLFTIVGIAVYLAYPIVFLLINRKKNRITFLSDQLLGLAVSLALLNTTFFTMFFLSVFRLSTVSVINSGLWRYAIRDRIPVFFAVYLPFVILVIESIVLYILIHFKVSDIAHIIKSRLIRKNISALNENQRDILHSNKNFVFRIKLLTEEAIKQYGTDKSRETLEAIRNLCTTNMETISKTLNQIKELNIHSVSCDFIEVLENAVVNAAIPSDIKVIKEYNYTNVQCFIDMYHIEQVITNLLNNSVDAVNSRVQDEPQIRIVVYSSASWVYCSISDTGCGVPKKLQKKIFMPYITTKSKMNNWGLGLTYVYRIIKAHYGQVRFRKPDDPFTAAVEILLPRSLPTRELNKIRRKQSNGKN